MRSSFDTLVTLSLFWSLIPISGIENLPALEWKRINIKKMDLQKHQDALDKLKKVLVI